MNFLTILSFALAAALEAPASSKAVQSVALSRQLTSNYQPDGAEHNRFSVTVEIQFGYGASVNFAPVIHATNSQQQTLISNHHGVFATGGVYRGSVEGLKTQITRLELDFPNGSPSSVTAICFEFGQDSVLSYQGPVCLPMALMAGCKTSYANASHIVLRDESSGGQSLSFCDQANCVRSLAVVDLAGFIHEVNSWIDGENSTESRCGSFSLTKPTHTVPVGKFTCYSFYEAKKSERTLQGDVPSSPDYYSGMFSFDICPIGNYQSVARASTLY